MAGPLSAPLDRPGAAAVAVGAVLYGSITVGGRYFAQRGLSLYEISLAGVAVAAVLLGLLAMFDARARLRRRDAGLLAAFGVVGAALQLTQFAGIVLGVPVAVVALLLYSQPVWTVLLGRLFLDEMLSTRKIGAVALALAGVVVLFAPALRGQQWPATGVAAGLLAGFLLSVWVVLGRVSGLRGNHALATGLGYTAPTAVVLIAILPALRAMPAVAAWSGLATEGTDVAWTAVRFDVLLAHAPAIGLYTLFASLAPLLAVAWGVRRVEASIAGVLMLLEPVSAALLAYLAFGEQLGDSAWLGGALIVASNGVLLRSGKRS